MSSAWLRGSRPSPTGPCRPRRGALGAYSLGALLLSFAFYAAASPRSLSGQPRSPLRVAAAADLQPVLPSLLRSYQQQTGHAAEASFASSATLATQIENGAPFDVFLSADMALPEKLVRDGFAAPGQAAQAYARGTLVLWARTQGGASAPLTIALLGTPAVHSVAIANPQHAPYGRAAMQALTSLGLLPQVQSKLRTAENIGQAAQFVLSGNADVGLLSLTSATSLGQQGQSSPVPLGSYSPIVQGAVVLRSVDHVEQAAEFLRYLHSPAVGEQLRRGGLEPLP